MNLFGMGTQEIVIILIAALVIFGPNRLPEIAGKLGKTVGDLKRMSSDLTSELERNTDIQDLKKTVQGEISGFKSQLNSVTDSAKKDLKSASGTAASTASSTAAKPSTPSSTISSAKPSTSTTSSTKSTSTSATDSAKPVIASKKDPLADFATFDEVKPAAAPVVSPTPTVPTSAAPAVASATSNGSSTDVDALTRARQRRMSAGYNQRAT